MENKDKKMEYPKISEKYRKETFVFSESKKEKKSSPKHKFTIGGFINRKINQVLKEIRDFFNKIIEIIKAFSRLIAFIIIIIILVSLGSGDGTGSNVSYKSYKENTSVSSLQIPELKKPKKVTFNWEYKGEEYSLTETLYESTYNFYKQAPKDYLCYGSCPDNWEESLWRMFVETGENDDTFSKLALDLEEIRQENDYLGLEFIMSFVQAIPYDYVLANNKNLKPKYPYETLYDNKGICSDKSFLAVMIAKELGYGVALLKYDQEEHMAVGIKCTYPNYDGGYCYTEVTTEGWKIGVIDLAEFIDLEDNVAPPVKSTPIIYEISDGKSYTGMLGTKLKSARIKEINKEIEVLEEEADECQNTLDSWEITLNRLRWNGSTYEYNSWVNKYNNKLSICQQQIDDLNYKISTYNQLVEDF